MTSYLNTINSEGVVLNLNNTAGQGVVIGNSLTSILGTRTFGASTIGAITGTSSATFSTTLGVTGLATFSGGLTSTAGTTTLGTSTIGAITGTSASFSSTLGVTGLATFGAGGLTSTAGTTTLGTSTIGAITGTSATFSSTLGVTGLATFGAGGLTSTAGTTTLGTSTIGSITGTSATFSSTLGVTGLATFSGGLTSTAGTTTLGTSTIGAITGTSATFSTTLGVTGLATFSGGLSSTAGTITLGASTIGEITGTSATFSSSTTSSSKTTGALNVTGGISTQDNLHIGGYLGLNGSTSGIISIKSQAVSGTYNFNLPVTSGTSGQVLTSQGGSTSAMTWTTPTTGTVTSIAVSTPSFLTVSGSPITTNGTIALSYSGTALPVANGGTGSTSFISNSLLVGNGTTAVGVTANASYTSNTLTLPKLVSNDSTATTSNSTGSILVSGGIGISNTTDATSSTNGGTITTSGGVAIAKKLYVGGASSFENGLSMNSTKITNLAEPTLSSDAATKQYVDIAVQGLDAKQSVLVATTVPGTLISSFQDGETIDGVSLSTGDRILIKDQGDVNNGVYIVNSSGAPTRASDFDTGSNVSGSFFFVEEGTVNSDSGWVCSSDSGVDVVGTHTLSFVQFSGAGSITAGTGLTKTGNILSVDASQTQITELGTITTGVWNSSVIGVQYGGTGSSSFTANSLLIGNGSGTLGISTNASYTANTLTLPKLVSNDTTTTTSNSTGSILVSGGIGIENTTDATSSTNGGTITTAGGIAVAKKAFIGNDLSVGGDLTVAGTAALPHGDLIGLSLDQHSQYALLVGRTGGQILTGGIDSGNNLVIRSSSNATKGRVLFDETTSSSSNSTGSVVFSGGIGILNTTDSTSSTNGGTITTAGGAAIAKKLYVGGDSSFEGNVGIGTSASVYSLSVKKDQNAFTSLDIRNIGQNDGTSGTMIRFGGYRDSNPDSHTVASIQCITVSSDIPQVKTGELTFSTGRNDNSGNYSQLQEHMRITRFGNIGVGNTSPGSKLDVTGTITSQSSIITNSTTSSSDTTGALTVVGGISTQENLHIGGYLGLNGSTSGIISITSQAASGTYNFNLPVTSGTAGQVLTSQGGSTTAMTWTTPTTGTVTSVAASVPSFLTVSGSPITTNGTIAISYSGTALPIANGGTGATTFNVNSVLLGSSSGSIQSPTTITYSSSTLTLPKLISNDSTASTSSALGSVLFSGGLSISNTTDAVSSTNGGTITSAGGIAIAKKAFIGDNLDVTGSTSSSGFLARGSTSGTVSILPQPNSGTFNFNLPITPGATGQILASAGGGSAPMSWITPALASAPQTYNASGSQSQASPVDVAGLVYTTGSFDISMTVDIVATTNIKQLFKLTGLLSPSSGWSINSISITGDDSLVSFSITAGGQVQYISGTYAGFTSLTFYWSEFSTTQGVGYLALSGANSGIVTISPQPDAGTYNYNLPTTAGTVGQVLTSAGGGSSPMTWANFTTGDITISGRVNQTLSGTSGLIALTSLIPSLANDNSNALVFGRTTASNESTVIRFVKKATTNYLGLGFWANDDIFNISASGYVGIGTTEPDGILHLRNNTNQNNIIFEAGRTSDGTNEGYSSINFNGYYDGVEQRINASKNRWRVVVDQRTTTDKMFIDTFDGTTQTAIINISTGGNIGIGTATESTYKLDVNGGVRISGPGTSVGTNGSLLVSGNDSFGHGMYVTNTDTTKRLVFNNTGSIGNIFSYDYDTVQPQDLILQSPGGNLGVGISPTVKLDVAGNGRFVQTIDGGQSLSISNPSAGTGAFSILSMGNNTANAFNVFLNSSTRTTDGGVNTATLRNEGGSLRLQSNSAGTSGIFINSSGSNIGIGTSTPGSKLHVTGGILSDAASSIESQGLHLQWNRNSGQGESWLINTTIGIDPGIRFGKSNLSDVVTELMRIQDNGNVGIGTTNPSSLLSARKDQNSFTSIQIRNNDQTTDTSGTELLFGGYRDVEQESHSLASIRCLTAPGDTSLVKSGNLTFLTGNGLAGGGYGSLFEHMRITTTGNVGIGTTIPGSKLDVNGTMNVSGAVTALKKMQSGVDSTVSSVVTVTFPTTFDTIPVVTATVESNSSVNFFIVNIYSVSASGFTFRKKYHDGTGWIDSTAEPVHWIAIVP